MLQKIKNLCKYINANGHKKVHFVCYADPPVKHYPSITAQDKSIPQIIRPKDWNLPKAIKKAKESPICNDVGLEDKIGQCIDANWCPIGGLIMLVELPLNQVFHAKPYSVMFNTTTLCACVKSYTYKRNNVIYLKEAEPFGFIAQEKLGCNKGAFSYFPNADSYNRIIYNYIKQDVGMIQRPTPNYSTVKRYFPKYNFQNNSLLSVIGRNTHLIGEALYL
jgi:hypothetical protein